MQRINALRADDENSLDTFYSEAGAFLRRDNRPVGAGTYATADWRTYSGAFTAAYGPRTPVHDHYFAVEHGTPSFMVLNEGISFTRDIVNRPNPDAIALASGR